MRGAALLLAAAMACPAQDGGAKAKQLLDQAVAALGGPRFMAMQDRIEEGRAFSFYHSRLSGLSRAKISTRYLTRPEPPQAGFVGVRERQSYGKNEDFYVLFQETGGYDVTYRGAQPLDAERYQRWRESTLQNILYILRQRIGEPGLELSYKGGEVFDNRPCEMVEIADPDNRIVTVWLDRTTHLPAKQFYYRRDAKTRERNEEVTIFGKYADAGGGVVWPHYLRRDRNGEKIFEIFSDSVRINNGLTDELFTLSGATKIIDKSKKRK